jgi:hypothetical protein
MKTLQALLFCFCVSSAQAADYLILCSGQSNMAGAAKVAELPEDLRPVPDNVLYFKTFDLTKPAEPLKSFAKSQRFGPVPSFLHDLSKARPTDRFIVLHYAVPGSELATWVPDYGPPELTSRPWKNGGTLKLNVGKCYRATTDRLAVLQKLYPEAKPLAFLWIQGESDKGKWAEVYLENFQRLVANVRRDMKSPDVFVIIGEPGSMEDGVRQAYDDYIKLDPRSGFAPTNGLGRDGVHYKASAYLELGRRMAKELEALMAKKVSGS